MMHQPMPDDPGWDANGAPTWEPQPLSDPAPADAPETHTCWICNHRGAPRTRSGLWFSVWRAFATGTLLVWTCSVYCQFCAVTLVDGLAGLLDIR